MGPLERYGAWQAQAIAALDVLIELERDDEAEGASAPPEGEWSTPMQKHEMKKRLGYLPEPAFKKLFNQYGGIELGRQSFRIRLDLMDSATRQRFEED